MVPRSTAPETSFTAGILVVAQVLIRADASKRLMGRLKSLDGATIAHISKESDTAPRTAALRLVTLDSFFVNDVFQKEVCDKQFALEMKVWKPNPAPTLAPAQK